MATSTAKKSGESGRKAAASETHRWSQSVTETSDAMTLEPGVFTRPANEIAASLKRSAEQSHRRKSTPFRSAMSMLTFYENRAGKSLSAPGRKKLEQAKDALRALFGAEKKEAKPRAKKGAAARRSPAAGDRKAVSARKTKPARAAKKPLS